MLTRVLFRSKGFEWDSVLLLDDFHRSVYSLEGSDNQQGEGLLEGFFGFCVCVLSVFLLNQE